MQNVPPGASRKISDNNNRNYAELFHPRVTPLNGRYARHNANRLIVFPDSGHDTPRSLHLYTTNCATNISQCASALITPTNVVDNVVPDVKLDLR